MKVRKSLLIFIFLISFLFFSCETLLDVLSSSSGGGSSSPYTNAEAVQAMKSALNIGAQSSSDQLSQEDAYYGNPLLKISLPTEVNSAIETLEKIPALGGLLGDLSGKLVENVVLSVNRSAEHAAKEVVPIFSTAITDMTVQDGIGIVTGKEDAATVYLKDKTYNQLMNLYQPKMNEVLDKDLIGSMSANTAWENLTGKFNEVVEDPIAQGLKAAGVYIPDPINTNLSEYVTGKALDGVFVKVAEEEAKIRENPLDYASAIVQKVFGAVKKGLGF